MSLFLTVVYGAADHQHGAVVARHAACQLLDLAPCLAVHLVVLWADVGEVVALFKSLPAPPHVGPRGHVAFVPAAAAVVLATGLGEVYLRVAAEAEVAVQLAVGLVGGEFPRHPVGAQRRVVVGGRVANVAHDVIALGDGRQFGPHGCRLLGYSIGRPTVAAGYKQHYCHYNQCSTGFLQLHFIICICLQRYKLFSIPTKIFIHHAVGISPLWHFFSTSSVTEELLNKCRRGSVGNPRGKGG